MNIEWDIPMQVVTPLGTLQLNQEPSVGPRYLLNPKRSFARRGIRAASDFIPQGDGEIFHDRYAEGSEMQLAIQLWDGEEVACDDVLVDMYDDLRGYLWSLLRPADDGGRIIWTPSGNPARLLDAVRLLSLADPEEDEDTGATQIIAVLDSPFPYAISSFEGAVTFAGTMTLANDGNVPFLPVLQVLGATSSFTITDNETGDEYVYSGTSIPGGQYAEIDFFRGGIIYLNGNQTNLKGSVDVEVSKILEIQPGGSSWSISGASAIVLTHDAWA